MEKSDSTYPNRQVQTDNESHLGPTVSGQRRAGAVDVYAAHRAEHDPDQHISRGEKLVSRAYTLRDNDLARDNLENDLPAADLQDL